MRMTSGALGQGCELDINSWETPGFWSNLPSNSQSDISSGFYLLKDPT